MKKIILSSLLAVGGMTAAVTSLNSCTASNPYGNNGGYNNPYGNQYPNNGGYGNPYPNQGGYGNPYPNQGGYGNNSGLTQTIMLAAIQAVIGMLGNSNGYMSYGMNQNSMTGNLANIFSVLQKVSPSLLNQAQSHVANAASSSVNVAMPILQNAVRNLSPAEWSAINAGGQNAAVQILRQKTEAQLMAALQPNIAGRIQKSGATQMLNQVIQGNQQLSGAFRGTGEAVTNELSSAVTQQTVNTIFHLMENYQAQNARNTSR